MAFISQILEAAKQHGLTSEPDMEVGDLQQLARDLWATLTPAQRKHFELMSGPVICWKDFIKQWPTGERRGQGQNLRSRRS